MATAPKTLEHKAESSRRCAPSKTVITGRNHRDRGSSGLTVFELGVAILAVLAECNGAPLPWASVRVRLPQAPYWSKLRALVALVEQGEIVAYKINGRTFIDAAITLGGAA